VTDPNRLKRYTTLAAAIDMLVESRLTLLSPYSWKDTNDVQFLDAYRHTLNLRSLCAACFTQSEETYHHWEVFAGSNEGVCIEIDKDRLLTSIMSDPRYIWRTVEYLTLEQINALKEVDAYRLPFMKRWGFRDESEFRLIWQSEAEEVSLFHVPIRRSWIKRVILNPWIAPGLFPSIKKSLQSIPECGSIRVVKTNLIDNAEWKSACERVDEFSALLGPPPRSI